MYTYLVTLHTISGVFHTLQIKGNSYADAEKQAKLFPTLSAIVQILQLN
jgi:hypothetical protein